MPSQESEIPPAGNPHIPQKISSRPDVADRTHPSSEISVEQPWVAVGPFRDDYFIGSIDVEWGFRAWSQGYQSICLLDVEMAHRWGTPVVESGQGWRPQIVRQSDLRTFYYLRNTVDLLRQSYVPWRTKVESAIRLMGQICLLLIWRKLNWQAFNVVGRALWAGAKEQLGPAPATIWKDDF